MYEFRKKPKEEIMYTNEEILERSHPDDKFWEGCLDPSGIKGEDEEKNEKTEPREKNLAWSTPII